MFIENNCQFSEEACWYKHEKEHDDEDKRPSGNSNSDSVFQKDSANMKPPISQPKRKQNLYKQV